MRDNALYFPYIGLPNSPWLLRTLLYWDRLFSIVPFDHTFERTANETLVRELVQEGLVAPIFPREHLYQVPAYEEAFIEYVRRKRNAMERRAATLFSLPSPRIPLHAEKLQGIADALVADRLATRTEGDWYEVEPWVANHLMTYLASVLGGLESVGAAPVTDHSVCFSLLSGSMPAQSGVGSEAKLRARTAILKELLPLPNTPIDIPSIVSFKKEQGGRLRGFRREIEKRCIDVAGAPEQDREEALRLAIDDLTDERDKIADLMAQRWKHVLLNPFLSVLGSGASLLARTVVGDTAAMVGLVGAGYSLIHTVYKAYQFNRDHAASLSKPMAYGVMFRKGFGQRANVE